MVADRLSRSIASMPDHFRLPGCGPQCTVVTARILGSGEFPQRIAIHDPQQHEAYGQYVLARDPLASLTWTVRTGPLTIDGMRACVQVHGERIHVTAREYAILSLLAAHTDRVVRYDDILRQAFGPEYAIEYGSITPWVENNNVHNLKVHICRLRPKLGDARDLLETNKGIGMMLRQETPV